MLKGFLQISTNQYKSVQVIYGQKGQKTHSDASYREESQTAREKQEKQSYRIMLQNIQSLF